MSRLNILILHRMGDPISYRESIYALEYMIPECSADINCVVHDADLTLPEYLKEVEYHLIVLGPTFLCSRYHPRSLKKILRDYDFIRESNACKVALPQDDYDCSSLLDDWMVRWRVDRLYTVCPDFWGVLYPNYQKFGEIKLGYTGYISDAWLKMWKDPKPHCARTIDISYRASRLSANFGSLGVLKSEIADKFVNALPDNNLRLNISIDPKDMIPGKKWHEFMEDSRFCLTTASGSSLLDRRGEFRKSVEIFLLQNPGADFDKTALHCFPGLDNEYVFTAISPRNIEAALAETVQIATPGSYSNLMHPFEHFIPLNENCSNINDILAMVADEALVDKIKFKCKEAILAEPRLRRTVIVNEILQYAESVVSKRNIFGTDQPKVKKLFNRYQQEIGSISKYFWWKSRISRTLFNQLGGKYLKR